jgi:hypothetical protein
MNLLKTNSLDLPKCLKENWTCEFTRLLIFNYLIKKILLNSFFFSVERCVLVFILFSSVVLGQNNGDFRTAESGNWNSISSWQFFDGTDWINAASIPTASTAGFILIRQNHTVTITASVTIDQTIIEYGGKLVLSGGTLTLANGEGTDLLILGIYERISSTSISLSTSATAVCGVTGTYIHNNEGGIIPIMSWQDGSLLHIKKSSFSTSIAGDNHLVQSFWDVYVEDGNDIRISGTATTSRTMVVRNNFNLAGGSFYLKRSNTVGSATSKLEVGNHFIQTGGNFNWNGDNEGAHIVQLFVGGDLRIENGNWGGFVSTNKCECGVYFNGNGIEQTYLTTLPHSIGGTIRDRFYYRSDINGPTGLHEVYESQVSSQNTIRGLICANLPSGFSAWPSGGNQLKTVSINNPISVELRSEKMINHFLFLKKGFFYTADFLTMNQNATIDRSGGTIDTTPAGVSYNVYYSPHTFGYFTGPEIPVSENVLFDLTINNGHEITLSLDHSLIHINNNLRIESGNFQVSPEYRVVLTNVYENVGGMATFENNSSLVQINDVVNSGSLTYKRIAQQRKLDYVYWSSPTADFNVSSHASNGPKYFWNTAQPNPNGSQGNWQIASGVKPQGKGVIVRGPSSFNNNTFQNLENSFIGVPNNGIITVPVQRGSIQNGFFVPSTPSNIWVTELDDNWNLVGNPYPSSISAKQFLLDNASVLTGGVSIWTHGTLPNQSIASPFYQNFVYNYSSNDYNIYNLSGNLLDTSMDYFIGAAQGFMVAMKDGIASNDFVSFSNLLRDKNYANQTGSQFFRTVNQTNNQQSGRFWLDLIKNENVSSRILVGYLEDATSQRDDLFDAITKNNNQFKLYSMDSELHYYRIQGRALPFNNNDSVPLGMEIMESGNYRIGLAFTDGFFNQGQSIYLLDYYLNQIHDLQSNYYEFYTPAGVLNDRFEIIYDPNFLGVAGNTNNDIIALRTSDSSIEIISQNDLLEEILIFDMLGRKLHHSYHSDKPTKIVITDVQDQNLILKIRFENSYKVIKIR